MTGNGLPRPAERRRGRRGTGSAMATALVVGCLLAMPAVSAQDFAVLAEAAIVRGEAPTTDAAGQVPGRLLDGLRYLAAYQRTGNRTDAERALFLFNQQAAAGRSPWPHYLSARAFELLDRLGQPTLNSDGKVEGERNVDGMWRQLEEGLRDDPDNAVLRALAIRHLVRGGDRELRDNQFGLLTRELARPVPLADAWLVKGRHERTNRRYREARDAFTAADTAGADAGVVALELARTARALDDTLAATVHYWQGLDRLTPAARDAFRLDLAWIVGEDSLAGFDRAADAGAARGWLERFWGSRDAASGRPPDGRLLEHLRRWVVAHERYRVPVPWTKDIYTRFWYIHGGRECVASATAFVDSLPIHPPHPEGDLRHREPLLDHRGFVYLRHGEPATRATPRNLDGSIESAVTRKSWVYWIEGRWRSFHFDASSTFGRHAPTTMMSYLPLDEIAWLSLAAMLPEYQEAASRIANDDDYPTPRSCLPAVKQAIVQQREDAALQWRTDSDTPRITAPWNAAVRTFALGTGARGDGRAVVSFALPFDQIAADTLLDDRIVWQARFTLTAYRPSDGTRIVVDSTRRFIGSTPPPDAHLSVLFELPLDAGRWEVTMTAGQGDGPRAYALSRNLVVDPGTTLSLSDVVTGREGSPPWTTPVGAFPLHPLGTWRTNETVELYYEVSGLAAGQQYATTLQVVPLNPRLTERIALTTTDRATGERTSVRKSLDLNRLRDGVYRVIVTVERDGMRATREQEILVVR